MFCKYCGNQIADDSAFCIYCGEQLNVVKENTAKETTQQVSAENKTDKPVPFILMLVVLGWNLLSIWGNVLIYGNRLNMVALSYTLALLAGLVFLGMMANTGKIRANAYRYSDLAVLCCVWLVVPYIMQRLTGGIMSHWYGDYAASSWSITVNGVEPAVGLSPVWVALAIAALDFARRGKRPEKKLLIILGAAILTCSLFGAIFAVVAVRGISLFNATIGGMGVPMEIMYQTVGSARVRMLLYWLWPPLILAVFHWLGTEELSMKEAMLILLSMSLARLVLLVLTVVVLRFGVMAACIIDAFVPLAGYLMVFLLRKGHK